MDYISVGHFSFIPRILFLAPVQHPSRHRYFVNRRYQIVIWGGQISPLRLIAAFPPNHGADSPAHCENLHSPGLPISADCWAMCVWYPPHEPYHADSRPHRNNAGFEQKFFYAEMISPVSLHELAALMLRVTIFAPCFSLGIFVFRC